MSQTLNEPAELTPKERRQEVAALLARGVLRLRQCSQATPALGQVATTQKTSESHRN
jgi:hypothetical protein